MHKLEKLSYRQTLRLEAQNMILQRAFQWDHVFDVLDLGTEYGWTGASVRKVFPASRIKGIEIHKPTLDTCREVNGHSYEDGGLLLMDAMEFLKSNPLCDEEGDSLYDVSIASELIEHLDKSEGYRLLETLREHFPLSIVTSPIGFMAQGEMYGNPHQVHKTGWKPEELELAGFSVFSLHPGCSLGVYYHDKLGRLQ